MRQEAEDTEFFVLFSLRFLTLSISFLEFVSCSLYFPLLFHLISVFLSSTSQSLIPMFLLFSPFPKFFQIESNPALLFSTIFLTLPFLSALQDIGGQEHFYPKAKSHLALHPLRRHVTWKQRAAQLAPCSCSDAHLYSSLGWAISTMSPSLMCGNTLGFTTSSSSERQFRDLRQQATHSVVDPQLSCGSHAGSLQPHHSVRQPHLTEEVPFKIPSIKASLVAPW